MIRATAGRLACPVAARWRTTTISARRATDAVPVDNSAHTSTSRSLVANLLVARISASLRTNAEARKHLSRFFERAAGSGRSLVRQIAASAAG
jgi:hypothetical protein